MNKIYSGEDRAKELGLKNYRDLIAYECKKTGERWRGDVDINATPAKAFVSWGRWLWQCECNNTLYAEPSDPVGFCCECGNVIHGGKARPVEFPANREEVEQALLEREIDANPLLLAKMASKHGASQTMLMPQFHPKEIARDWKPGETVEGLRNEHKAAKEFKEQHEKKVKDG